MHCVSATAVLVFEQATIEVGLNFVFESTDRPQEPSHTPFPAAPHDHLLPKHGSFASSDENDSKF